jgi:hypothetical protein
MKEFAQQVAQSPKTTYAIGGFMAWFSHYLPLINDILQLMLGLIGLAVCAARGYYDYCKHKKDSKDE